MTEDEAKTKWCPMIRFSLGEVAHYSNREEVADASNAKSRCIGSACMMWRISHRMYSKIGADGFPTKDSNEIFEGYCGLAGKP